MLDKRADATFKWSYSQNAEKLDSMEASSINHLAEFLSLSLTEALWRAVNSVV